MAQEAPLLRFLALGDSYTIGESVPQNKRWPVQLADELNQQGFKVAAPKIIAQTGWRTDDLMQAIQEDEALLARYDLVSLLIGVNNQYQGKDIAVYEEEFEILLNTAIELAGNDPGNVFVVSIPDYGKTPFGAQKEEQIEQEINTYNDINQAIAKNYGVAYVDITPFSREAKQRSELIAEDNLHPSGLMYTGWVELMKDTVLKLLKP